VELEVAANLVRIKAISLKQPWASWIADGRKTIETRTWRTKHRDWLLVCAGMTFDESTGEKHFKYPVGVALCLARIVDCRPMREEDDVAACCPWTSGRYAWVIDGVLRVDPFRVKGARGLFPVDVPADLVRKAWSIGDDDRG